MEHRKKMFGITTSVLYLYCYFSVIFNALTSSLVCLTSLYYCKKSSDMVAEVLLRRGAPAMVQMVQWLIRPWAFVSLYHILALRRLNSNCRTSETRRLQAEKETGIRY